MISETTEVIWESEEEDDWKDFLALFGDFEKKIFILHIQRDIEENDNNESIIEFELTFIFKNVAYKYSRLQFKELEYSKHENVGLRFNEGLVFSEQQIGEFSIQVANHQNFISAKKDNQRRIFI